jgi:hypothetical protein
MDFSSEKRTTRERPSSYPLDPDRTLTLVRPSTGLANPARSSAHARKSDQHSLRGYLVAAAVGALLVAFGVFLGGLVRGMEPWLQQRGSDAALDSRPQLRATREAVAVPVASDAVSGATAVIASRHAPEQSSAEPSGDRTIDKPSSVAPRRSARPKARTAHLEEKLVASRAEAAEPTLASTRYCARVGDTVFRPGHLTVAGESEDIAAQPPRADSGLMRLLFTVSLPPTFATVSFENGGDTSVYLQRLEESTSGHGFRVVTAALPASVSAGGVRELFRYPVAPGKHETYERQFVAVDRRGDSWTAAVELAPCQN